MSDFPFEQVYEHFARRLVQVGLDPHTMPPILAVGRVDGTTLERVEVFPTELVAPMFKSAQSKRMLKDLIDMALSGFPDENSFLIVMSEAFRRITRSAEVAAELSKTGIQNDPEADEVVMIAIYTRTGNRFGYLPIKADRSLEFEPLLAVEILSGNLAVHADSGAL